MKSVEWMEDEEGPYLPTIIWESSVEAFLEQLVKEQELCSDIFAEIEKALSGKIQRGKESQRIVIFSGTSEFPTLAIHLLEKREERERCISIIGVGIHIEIFPQ